MKQDNFFREGAGYYGQMFFCCHQ